MEFSSYIWSLYRESQTGKDSIQKYSCLTKEFEDCGERILEFPYVTTTGEEKVHEVDLVDLIHTFASKHKINTIDEASTFYQDTLLLDDLPFDLPADAADDSCEEGFDDDVEPMAAPVVEPTLNDGNDEESDSATSEIDWSLWYDCVGAISLTLHLTHPDFFVPFMFRRKFHAFQRICDQFGIPLPPVPGKGSKEARARYYGHVNRALYEFRISRKLSSTELCAFLYDFAMNCCGISATSDLPLPYPFTPLAHPQRLS